MKLGTDHQLEFDVTDGVRQLGVKGAYFVLDFDPAAADAAKSTALLLETQQTIRAQQPNVKEDAILHGFRELHTAAGVSNRKNISSPENLISLILGGRALASINPIVDVYNAVSLQTKLALGAHDISKLDGSIALRRTDGSELFLPIGSPDPKKITSGEYGYVDEGANEVICRLETRQCEKTKVGSASRSCFFIVQGNTHTDLSYIQDAAARLQDLLQVYAGGGKTDGIYWLE